MTTETTNKEPERLWLWRDNMYYPHVDFVEPNKPIRPVQGYIRADVVQQLERQRDQLQEEIDSIFKHPPCRECGAMDQKDAETRCICSGDKDDCHGCKLWPE